MYLFVIIAILILLLIFRKKQQDVQREMFQHKIVGTIFNSKAGPITPNDPYVAIYDREPFLEYHNVRTMGICQ